MCLLILAPLLALPGATDAAALPPLGFTDSLVASVPSPTAIAPLPDGRILVGTQSGRVRLLHDGSLQATPALDLSATSPQAPAEPVCFNFERGLLGLAVDPQFATNGFIYVFAARRRANGTCVNRVSRFVLNGDLALPSSEVKLLDNIFVDPGGGHSGGDLHFGKDGLLYVSVGDGYCDYAGNSSCGGLNDAARDRHVVLGKILRITRDGGVPAGNPFATTGRRCNVAGQTTQGFHCQETFAWGLRNPFRFAFDPNAAGTRFFINDVGNNHWEEIDEGQAGADYGWNLREGHCVRASFTNCGAAPAGMTNPIYDYSHQGDCDGITGGAFVPAGLWPAPYDGAYLFSDYVCGRIFRLEPAAGGGYTAVEFATGLGASSAVAMAFGPHGSTQALYYTTYAGGGEIRRIAFTGNGLPTARLTATPASGAAPLDVDFDGSASTDPDDDPLTYVWDFGDGSPVTETTSATTSHTYDASSPTPPPRSYRATLRVRDSHGGLSDPVRVSVDVDNTPPTPHIESPLTALRFGVGDQIALEGRATDPEDGVLPDTSLTWEVVRAHNEHTHPFLSSRQGTDGAVDAQFAAPSPEDLAAAGTSGLELRLTATDAQGGSRTVTQQVRPNVVDVTLASNPRGAGLRVEGNDGAAPQSFQSWEGYRFPVEAARRFGTGGGVFEFLSWSDGRPAGRMFTTPGNDLALTAAYRRLSSAYRSRVLSSPGLLAYWRLGERRGTRAFDETGRHHGTYDGGPGLGQFGALAGDLNGAVDLASPHHRVVLPGQPLALAGNGTLEGWLDGAGHAVFRDSAPGGRGWVLAFDLRGRLTYRVGGHNFPTPIPIASLRGGWHHFVLTKTGGATAYYVDGRLVHTTRKAPSTAALQPWRVVRAGEDESAAARADEIAVYNRALSAREVAEHCVARLGYAGLVPAAPAPSAQCPFSPLLFQTPDVRRPRASVRIPPKLSFARLARTGRLKVRVVSDEAGSLAVVVRQRRLLPLRAGAARLALLGRATRAIARPGSVTITVKLRKKALRRIRRARLVKLRIATSVTDAAGNTARVLRGVTLRRR